MAGLSTDIGFIQPREVEVIQYGDFVGSQEGKENTAENSSRGEYPLDLKFKSNQERARFSGCLLALFSANSISADLIKELVNSFNKQLSGAPYKLGYVDLTQDRRIVNNIINTAQVIGEEFKNFIPPYFVVYINGKFKGFFNPPSYQVTAILDKLRQNPRMCEDGQGLDKINTFPFVPEVNFAVTSQQRTGEVYNTNKPQGLAAYNKTQQSNTAAAQQQAAVAQSGAQGEQAARQRVISGIEANLGRK